jgi:alpha-L-fucosidase
MPDLTWFTEARFGLFIHYGAYSAIARGEWVMNQEGIPPATYAAHARAMRTRPGAPRDWCRRAREAGARYVVFTTKHHDGFCLWDSSACAYNSVRLGPRRDLVREFVDAARAEGLRVGLYYSLADWTHPDGARCATDTAARRRFVAYTHALVRELCTGYGPLDLLWFDGPWPLRSAARWQSRRLLATIRRLQPGCLVNNRLGTDFPGDFGTPEGHVAAEGRPWEACMTMNGDWGFTDTPQADWLSPRELARLLRSCAAQGGNLLLNVGPEGDGALPAQARERLARIGRWLAVHGEACLGPQDRIAGRLPFITNLGFWTLRETTAWFWLARAWPGQSLDLGGLRGKLRHATLLHEPARKLRIQKTTLGWRVSGLPEKNTEPALGVPVLRLEFAEAPTQVFPFPH